MTRLQLLGPASAAVALIVTAAGLGYIVRAEVALRERASAEQHGVAGIEERLAAIEARQPVDWPATAAAVERSVVTIDAGDSLGSAWVAAPCRASCVRIYNAPSFRFI